MPRASCARVLGFAVVASALLAAPAAAISPQTLTDPVGDNCKDYNFGPMGVQNRCGPDITQAVFSTPGDGNLHVDITYASLPSSPIQELVEYVEVGIYPKGATSTSLFTTPGAMRVTRSAIGWTLQKLDNGFKVVASVTATPRALGIDLAVPLANLPGDPSTLRHVVNAGSTGEVVPEHPDLAPNTGFFDLAGDPAPPATTAPPPASGPPTTTPAPVAPVLRSLSKIPAAQRGGAISGQVEVGAAGDLTVEAFVPAAKIAAKKKAKLKSIGKLTKKGVRAGKVSFRLPLKKSARKKLAGKKTAITLRVTLKPASGAAQTLTRKVNLTVPG